MPSPRFQKGNKLRTGIVPWNKGKKTGLAPWLGKKRSPETIKKMSEAMNGKPSPMLGKRHTEETKKKISESRKRMFGKNHPSWKGGKPKCKDCNKQLGNIYAKYCSSCAKKGERSPRWKGGVTSAKRLDRGKFQRDIQKKILERDDYTCQMCNTRGGILHVDHIQSFAEYLERRFDMDNCRTLCVKCHYKITFKREMPQSSCWGQAFVKGGRFHVVQD